MASPEAPAPVGYPAPMRPPMDSASGVRRIKLSPHETVDEITATEDAFVLAHHIARVEVSVDGGEGFAAAALEPRRGWQWRRFSLPWVPDAIGETVLKVRAFDSGGTIQPFDGARNAIHAVRVVIA